VISHNGVRRGARGSAGAGTDTTEPDQECISILEIQTAFHFKERERRKKYNGAVQPLLASNQSKDLQLEEAS